MTCKVVRGAKIGVAPVVVVSGELHADVNVDESAWQLGDDGALEVSLAKMVGARSAGRLVKEGWWARVLESDPRRDVAYCDAGSEYVKVDPRAVGMAPPKHIDD